MKYFLMLVLLAGPVQPQNCFDPKAEIESLKQAPSLAAIARKYRSQGLSPMKIAVEGKFSEMTNGLLMYSMSVSQDSSEMVVFYFDRTDSLLTMVHYTVRSVTDNVRRDSLWNATSQRLGHPAKERDLLTMGKRRQWETPMFTVRLISIEAGMRTTTLSYTLKR